MQMSVMYKAAGGGGGRGRALVRAFTNNESAVTEWTPRPVTRSVAPARRSGYFFAEDFTITNSDALRHVDARTACGTEGNTFGEKRRDILAEAVNEAERVPAVSAVDELLRLLARYGKVKKLILEKRQVEQSEIVRGAGSDKKCVIEIFHQHLGVGERSAALPLTNCLHIDFKGPLVGHLPQVSFLKRHLSAQPHLQQAGLGLPVVEGLAPPRT
ncbi:hypothetical protein EVAR_51539_1 [Eumeta japonica]|uniref:Uncharacterized protein n=1 Tax=Eumeta variegata TaxID=151549 RepID=A0A4C1XAY4_EUMVA|nr:hypothetical protein EVAR_51539_1 [Eumeta japonica]